MLPLGGLLIALFVGWVVPKTIVIEQLSLTGAAGRIAWLILVRIVAPVGVLGVFGYTIYSTIS